MKKHMLISLGFIFFLSIHAFPALCGDVSGPKIVVEKPDFDFNAVEEGAVVEHTFKVLNQGDQTLQIFSVRPG